VKDEQVKGEHMVDDYSDALSAIFEQYLQSDAGITDKQRRILEAAVEIFSKKGYAAASTSEIASRAGVAEGTIFKHYKTKKGLLLSIVSPTILKLGAPVVLRRFEKVLEAPYDTFGDFLRALLRDRFEFAQKNTMTLKILIQEVSYHPEFQALLKELFSERIFPKIEKVIEHFQAKGDIKKLPSLTILRWIITLGIGYVGTRLMILPDHEWDDEWEIEQMVEFITKGLAP